MTRQKIPSVLSLKKSKKRFIGSESFWCYLMLLLPITGFVVFQVYPVLWTFKWAFYSYSGVPSETRFVGLANFKTMFSTDLTYWKSWGNTLLIAGLRIPVEIGLAMGLALILNKKRKGSGFFQAMFYLPHIISTAIIGLIVSSMFSYFGIVNGILVEFGLIDVGIDWFARRSTALGMITFASTWAHFGVNVMYFLAAFANVPAELYECAGLDGASKSVTFFKITLPVIAPIFSTIMLLAIMRGLSMNELIIILTNGGPYGQTNTVMSYLYTKFVPGFAEDNIQIGYGCAMSLITTILFSLIAVGYSRVNKWLKGLY